MSTTDAVNVVCRDNHVLNNIPLFVFLYDERSGSVYSGRHTVSTQDPRTRSVHAVDVPVVDREAFTTVLVTCINSLITDDDLNSAFYELDKGRRPVQNTKRLRNTGIAFVQYQHHEDAITVAGMKQVSVSVRLGPRTVNLFLYLGPLPGHTDRPHRTKISTADQHGTDTAPGALPIPQHDPQPRDARCVSVELQPPEAHSAHGKADTPDAHIVHGKADTPDVHTAHGKADTPDAHTAHGKAGTPDAHTAHGKADTPDAHIVHGKADTPDVHTAHGKADTPDAHTAHGKADTPATHAEVKDQRTQAECGPQSHAVYDGQTAQIQSLLQEELGRMEARMKADMKAEIEGEMRAKIKAEMKTENETKLQAEVTRLQTHMENQLHIRLQQEVQQRNNLQALVSSTVTQLRSEISQPRPEVSQLQNQLRSEVSKLRAQLTSEINLLKSEANETRPEVNQLKADVTRLQTQASGVTQSQAQLRSQITREITRTQAQLQSEITQLQAGLQDQLRECRESNAQTKSSLEIRSRMHSRLVSETQTAINEHVTAEIVTLTGTIHTLTNQIAAIQTRLANPASQASGRIVIEEDIAVVANPSGSTSSRPSSDAPS
ncbi:hypothetical protein BaRGS_00035970 [Batillaria attramentaria]|uniref:RRM domain-containing protein n=1 Tax=Batillaria attramentaria TaxID=370345 RepID=A0ABD0JEK8_9CAEN